MYRYSCVPFIWKKKSNFLICAKLKHYDSPEIRTDLERQKSSPELLSKWELKLHFLNKLLLIWCVKTNAANNSNLALKFKA